MRALAAGRASARSLLDRLSVALLAHPVDPASLAAFRFLFGLVMALAMIRFIALGWVDEFYVRPAFHFTWAPFGWIRPLPGWLMHLHFAALAVCALCVAVGFHYRAAAALFFLGFTYVELIDKATYLNHYYLVSLLSGLLVFLPAARLWSVDAWRGPQVDAAKVPAWTINILRFQLAVVYVFAGLAKLNADWLLDAQPLGLWLAARSDVPLIGTMLSERWVAYAFSWSGALYDLSIVFFLLWRRTRRVAYLTVFLFHMMTGVLFPIGMFPWIMIAATLIFFPAEWPRRWLRGSNVVSDTQPVVRPAVSTRVAALIAAYCLIQVLIPLRSHWPGTHHEWSGKGFNFSWRVMLVEKSGYVEFVARRPSAATEWRVPVSTYITERQERMMAQDPEMVRALARRIADDLRAQGMGDVEVRANAFASLNGRPVQPLVDPRVNLAGPLPSHWIVPLERDSDVRLTKFSPPDPAPVDRH